MAEVKLLLKQTNNKFLNLYEMDYVKQGIERTYYIASRKEDSKDLACVNPGVINCDAVMIIPVFEDDKVLFIKQFRPVINDYIYEFPAGLVDTTDDSLVQTGVRELFEETGLEVIDVQEFLSPRYISVGLSDESLAVYLAVVKGTLTTRNQEENEDISFEIINIDNVKDFVHTHNVAMQASLVSLFLDKCNESQK